MQAHIFSTVHNQPPRLTQPPILSRIGNGTALWLGRYPVNFILVYL